MLLFGLMYKRGVPFDAQANFVAQACVEFALPGVLMAFCWSRIAFGQTSRVLVHGGHDGDVKTVRPLLQLCFECFSHTLNVSLIFVLQLCLQECVHSHNVQYRSLSADKLSPNVLHHAL